MFATGIKPRSSNEISASVNHFRMNECAWQMFKTQTQQRTEAAFYQFQSRPSFSIDGCNDGCADICSLSPIISRKWAVITDSGTYLKPGETVAQLPDLSQMQYGSRDDRQLLQRQTDRQTVRHGSDCEEQRNIITFL